MRINIPKRLIILGSSGQIFSALITDNLVDKVATQIAYYPRHDILKK